MYFLIRDDDFLEKYNVIWDKVLVDIKTVYNKKFFETKILSYGNEAIDSHNKEIPKAGSDYTCLAVISIDSTLKKMETIIQKCF